MRLFSTLLIVVATACTPQDVVTPGGTARFTEYPDMLIEAFESSCSEPSQTFSRPQPDLFECREFLEPEATAAIILGFDGNPEDLPQLVVQFHTRPDGPGYLVENDVFLNVPQKTGGAVQLRQYDPSLGRTLARLYKRSGGVPE